MSPIRCMAVISLVLFLGACRTGTLVTYPSTIEDFNLSSSLSFPEKAAGPVPAMIIVHGSSGPSARGEQWGALFRAAGIATLEIDYFGPRGVDQNSSFQPQPVLDVIDAFKYLQTDSRIDSNRIGAIGFSRGAGMVITAGNWEPQRMGGKTLAAVVALYPMCGSDNIVEGEKSPPVLVMIGTEDSYSTPLACQNLQATGQARGRTVELKVYEGAYHAWDGNWSGTWYHRAIKRNVEIRSSSAIRKASEADVMDFIGRYLL